MNDDSSQDANGTPFADTPGSAELLITCQGRERVLTGYEPAGETLVYTLPDHLLPGFESLRDSGWSVQAAMERLGVEPNKKAEERDERAS